MPENIGHVIKVAGPAVDVQFVEASMPPIYQALQVVSDGFQVPFPIKVILEVQQHLGEGRVRCIAMEPTDGMVRGMKTIDLGGRGEVPDPPRPHLGAGGSRHSGARDERHWRTGRQAWPYPAHAKDADSSSCAAFR